MIFTCWIVLSASIIYMDFSKRIIYNWQVLLALMLSLASAYFFNYSLNFWAFVFVLLVGISLWKFQAIGAGDIKLLSILVLNFSTNYVVLLLMIMSILGLLIAIIYLIFKKQRDIPYAPAICIAHLIVFYLSIR